MYLTHNIGSASALPIIWLKAATVREEIFEGEKFRTFPSKIFRIELSFVLSEWLKEVKTRRYDRKACNQVEENLVWKFISYFFLFYESYELNFVRKFLLLQCSLTHQCTTCHHPWSPLCTHRQSCQLSQCTLRWSGDMCCCPSIR